MINTEWVNEEVEKIPGHRSLYRLLCFIAGRKLKYKELFMILDRINGEENKTKTVRYINDLHDINNKTKKNE